MRHRKNKKQRKQMVNLGEASFRDLCEINVITRKTEEQRLLSRLSQGDRQAFWQLWELYRNYLYHRCLVWMGGNHDDANEVMSLASLKAWDKLPNYVENITNLKGWLNRFTHNLCMDIHHQRKHHAVGCNNIDEIVVEQQELEIPSSNSPQSSLLQQEQKIYLRYCIDSLPSRLRDPIVLRYYQALSHADIAQKLAISQDNVAKRLRQAKQILKKHLCEYFAGLKTEKISETQSQQLEQKDFCASINADFNLEELNYRITISCLETLPPVWYNLPHQDSILMPI